MNIYDMGPWAVVQSCLGDPEVATRRDDESDDQCISRHSAAVACSIGDHTETRTSGDNVYKIAELIAAAPALAKELKEIVTIVEKEGTAALIEWDAEQALKIIGRLDSVEDGWRLFE